MKYLYILVFKVLLNRLTMASLLSGLWFVWKITPWFFKYCWRVAWTNSVPLSGSIVIRYLFWNKDFETHVSWVLVLSFRGTLPLTFQNISITFKRYLYLSLYFERGLKSARSISLASSIFVTVNGFIGNLFLTGLSKVYVSRTDNQSATSYFNSHYQLCYWTKPCCVFRVVINFTQRHYYCTGSQGSWFLSVNSCRVFLYMLVYPESWPCFYQD